MKIPLPAKLRAFAKSVKRASPSTDDEENKQLEEENERLKIQHERLAKQLEAQLEADEILRKMVGPPIHINFIDEDGEVLQIKARPSEETSNLFNRYLHQQRTPFLLSRALMYEFRYNGELVPFNSGGKTVPFDEVTIGSIGIEDTGAIIYVRTKLSDKTDFKYRIIPNIPSYVKSHPRCFINQRLSIQWGSDGSILSDEVRDYNRYTGSFIIATNKRNATSEVIQQYDRDQFTVLLQDYYSPDTKGFLMDHMMFLENLVQKHETQVEQLDNQSLYTPNAIILRIIKIKQQIHRLLDYINTFREGDLFDHFIDRLSDALSSLADKKKGHLSHKYIHRVNKPLLEPDEVVRVKQWNDETLEYSWEKGTIRSYTEHEGVGGYGFRRVYSVEFNNGECRSDVEDYHVIPEDNYTNKSWESIGINRVFDKDSLDPWAGEVGWYTVELDGVEEPFVYLSDAIRAVNLKHDATAEQQNSMAIYHEFQVKFGMLQSIDRLSDPIMQRIGRILIQLKDSIHGVKSGFIWKMAYGQWNDSHTTQMRDSVYEFALLKQSKIFGSYGSVNIDQVCRFFISSEGCLDTFLLKVPIFREGYDSTVPSKHKNEQGRQADPEIIMTYLKRNRPDDADEFMFVRFVCGNNDTERYTVSFNAPFKELLMRYADDRHTSVKSLRIKHNGMTIFLSSIGRKTPRELGINDNDTIEVTILQTTNKTTSNEQPKQSSPNGKKNKKNKKHKKSKKKRTQPLVIQKTEVELKVEHSRLLGKVYEEAEPTFKEIRQRLNAMNLERTKPKQRTSPSKTTEQVEVVDNPIGEDQLLGGKAGKTQFIIQVGEVSNLYKTTKSTSSPSRGRRQDDIMIDLHGLTAEEAVHQLDKSLPDWLETAMKGTYPFVIPVKIVCGGGSQILAEVVENWIKQNDNVANAPKNMY